VSPNRRYPLELDQAEVERYRTMAEAARQAEADLCRHRGGARVADVGCGPGKMLPTFFAPMFTAIGRHPTVRPTHQHVRS
jgi:hypothetical protein